MVCCSSIRFILDTRLNDFGLIFSREAMFCFHSSIEQEGDSLVIITSTFYLSTIYYCFLRTTIHLFPSLQLTFLAVQKQLRTGEALIVSVLHIAVSRAHFITWFTLRVSDMLHTLQESIRALDNSNHSVRKRIQRNAREFRDSESVAPSQSHWPTP